MFRLLACAAIAAYSAYSAAVAGAESLTFAKDVAPIVFAKCANCHRAGEVAPFPLTNYAELRKRAKQIAAVTERRIMPPWKPEAEPGTFKYDRSLTAEEIAVFQAWAAAGAPEGDPREVPPMPDYPSGWHLGEPDMILALERPYEVYAEGPDVYVHFVFPMDLPEDKYIRAVQVLPSNPSVAHHGVILLDGGGTARKLAADDEEYREFGDRYRNGGDPGFVTRGFLPGYAPGQATREPEKSKAGVGLTLGQGLDLVLQMHYHPIGRPATDQPRIGLYFTDEKPRRGPNVVGMANNAIDIAPGDDRFVRRDSFKLPVDFEVHTIWGHMHLIGATTRVWAELPGGETKELLWIPDWDFNWQDTYVYAEPFVLPYGTLIRAEWTWDNSENNPQNPSAPPRRVVWGPDSDDEMSGLIVGGVTVNEGFADGLMWLHVLGHFLETERKAKDAQARREPKAD